MAIADRSFSEKIFIFSPGSYLSLRNVLSYQLTAKNYVFY